MIASLMAAGAQNLNMPQMTSAVAEFDAWLVAEPTRIDAERLALLSELGVA